MLFNAILPADVATMVLRVTVQRAVPGVEKDRRVEQGHY